MSSWAEALLNRFVVPFVGGDKIHIAAPLGVRGAQQLAEKAALGADGMDLETLFGRHTLLAPLFALERVDVRRDDDGEVKVYEGVTPPRRWLSADDEDEVRKTVVLPDLVAREKPGDALPALLAASPLTDLYHPLRDARLPAMTLGKNAGWLRAGAVAQLLTRRYCELDWLAVGSRITTQLVAEGEAKKLRGAAAAAWLCLLSHLHLVAHVVGEAELPAENAAAETLDFYGLYAALSRSFPALAMPPDVRADASLFAVAHRHAGRCLTLAGAHVQKMLSMLGKLHVETV